MEQFGNREKNSSYQAGGKLQVFAGSFRGETIPIEDGETIFVGRDINKCAVICKSPKVSRVHVSISYQGKKNGQNEYVVRDLSTNGTISSMTGYLPKDQDVLITAGTEIGLGRSDESIRFL